MLLQCVSILEPYQDNADIMGPRWVGKQGGRLVKSRHGHVGFPPVNIFLGGDSLTQIEPSLGGLPLLVSEGGGRSGGARSPEIHMTFEEAD